jgi:hypothetical protein
MQLAKPKFQPLEVVRKQESCDIEKQVVRACIGTQRIRSGPKGIPADCTARIKEIFHTSGSNRNRSMKPILVIERKAITCLGSRSNAWWQTRCLVELRLKRVKIDVERISGGEILSSEANYNGTNFELE